MKKYIALFLSLIICISFSACGKAPDAEPNVGVIGENTGTTENAEEYSGNESVSVSESSDEISLNESTNARGSTEKRNTETKNFSSKAEISTAPTVIPAESSTQPQSKTACTVEIECKSILSKKNNFKKDISLVPSNGIILSTVSVNFDDGASAYDVLQKVCAQNGIALNAQKSSFGIYIVGIGGIDEKDCGQQSGWVYTVNGKSPSVGLGNYKIKNGDSIVLSYVC